METELHCTGCFLAEQEILGGEAENYGAGMKNSTFVSFDGIFSDIAFNKIQGTRKLCHCTK